MLIKIKLIAATSIACGDRFIAALAQRVLELVELNWNVLLKKVLFFYEPVGI